MGLPCRLTIRVALLSSRRRGLAAQHSGAGRWAAGRARGWEGNADSRGDDGEVLRSAGHFRVRAHRASSRVATFLGTLLRAAEPRSGGGAATEATGP